MTEPLDPRTFPNRTDTKRSLGVFRDSCGELLGEEFRFTENARGVGGFVGGNVDEVSDPVVH